MRRRLTALLLCLAPAPQAGAHDGDKHGKDICYVLFGKNWNASSLSDSQSEKLDALLCATQLCIDQFNGNGDGTNDLNELRANYRRMPSSIEDINLNAGGNTHRRYTHRGWDESYADVCDEKNPDWTKHWQRRKKLLTDVAEQIFDFDGRWKLLDKILPYPCTAECKAFCKLLYYIHLTSDYTAFDLSKYEAAMNDMQGKGQILKLATTQGKSVISELQEVSVELFGEERASELVRDLEEINIEVVKLLNDPDAMRTEEGVKQYTDYAQDVLDTLADHIPNLLKEKDFFSKVFC